MSQSGVTDLNGQQKITGPVEVVQPDGNLLHVTVDAIGGNATAAYAEVLNVASGVTTTVCSFTAAQASRLKSVMAAGTNIAMFTVQINASTVAQQYTNFGASLNVVFDFKEGMDLVASDVVVVKILHQRPYSGDFNATIITQV